MSNYLLTAAQFIENAKKYLGYKYAYAATGETLTEALIKNWAVMYPNVYTTSYLTRTLKNTGNKGTDCSGLCYLATDRKASRLSSAGLLALAQASGKVVSLASAPAGAILYKSRHVGIKISPKEHIEARGVDYGVVIMPISSQTWANALLMPYIDYSAVSLATSQVPRPTLRKGDKGEDVKTLQKLLNKKINAGLVMDGIFGVNTYVAVTVYQTKYGLVADGIVGPLTWVELLK